MKGGLGNLMKQAQKMQKDMAKAQEELANIEVTGESGGGLVKIKMSCKHQVKNINIDPSLLSDDVDMLEDLISAAFNDAVTKVAATSQEHMSSLTAGLPPGFNLPF